MRAFRHVGYDNADQLTAAILKATVPPGQVLKRYYYSYDPAGNRTAEQIDDAVTGASYDNMNQLVSQQAGGALVFKGTVSEPANVTIGGKPATVTPDNRFEGQAVVPGGTGQVAVTATDPSGNVRTSTYQVSQGASSKSFTYDLNGNLTSDGSQTYTWDAEDRLVAVSQGGSALASFTYDGGGRRATKAASGVTTTYVYDSRQFLEERSSAGLTKRYVYGPSIDQPLGQIADGMTTYNVADHLGSVVRTVDSSGSPTLTREYDPWGNPLQGSATSGYAFTGREWDAETGLYYYRARYYQPRAASFIGEDPSGESSATRRYSYADGNPISLADPLGLFTIETADPEHMSQDIWNGVFSSTLRACSRLDSTITDPKLRACLKKSCERGTIQLLCHCRPCELGMEDISLNFIVPWTIRTAKLCANNWKYLAKAPPGDVAIHEWAHGCGWGHYDGRGVPGDPEFKVPCP